jgi:hypothetical protein
MTNSSDEQTVSRRNFIRNLAIAAMAATTAGTTAAMLSKEWNKSTVSPAVIREVPKIPPAPTSIPAVQSAQTVVTAQNDASELLARLAESQAENMRLQAALQAAQSDLESLAVTNNSNRSATEELSIQLADATERLGLLSGLVTLYEQLDEIDVTETVQNGLTTVSDSINELVDQTPALSEGIELGQQALAEVEEHLPLLEDGRVWMEAQANKLSAFYDSVEVILQGVLESVGSFLDLVENWFDGVRKWLPFGIDEKAALVVTALSDLVAETPHTINGLDTYIAKPLDAWLVREEDAPRLHRTLIKPIREQVLAEANETINRAHTVKASYEEQLALPVEVTVSNRNALREQIASYRQQYQI